ncbi:MAG: ribose 5-phosphate isomerase B [Chloroflexi bacterium HGW-Chloroflexi-1]|nr:MAG: ribose 5-phosphate isomerase B [Chloroflexi bacterium HGW-Chloroflexi-1]
MKVAVACDHGGFPLKQIVLAAVKAAGHQPLDLGTNGLERVDYPDFARKVGAAIKAGQADRGVLICGSGAGAAIAANKIRGIYASVCHDTYSAHQAVEHDAMNVLCLGARIIGPEVARELVTAFLAAAYLDTGNYARRVNQIHQMEAAL